MFILRNSIKISKGQIRPCVEPSVTYNVFGKNITLAIQVKFKTYNVNLTYAYVFLEI